MMCHKGDIFYLRVEHKGLGLGLGLVECIYGLYVKVGAVVAVTWPLVGG